MRHAIFLAAFFTIAGVTAAYARTSAANRVLIIYSGMAVAGALFVAGVGWDIAKLTDDRLGRIQQLLERIAAAVEAQAAQASERPDDLAPVDVDAQHVPDAVAAPAGEHEDGVAGEQVATADHQAAGSS